MLTDGSTQVVDANCRPTPPSKRISCAIASHPQNAPTISHMSALPV